VPSFSSSPHRICPISNPERRRGYHDRQRSQNGQLAFQQALGIHPFEKQQWPIGDWQWVGLSNTEAMAYPSINMELSGYVETAQSKIELDQALRDVGPVVASAGQKGAWCLGR
jgi:hypothetical protein